MEEFQVGDIVDLFLNNDVRRGRVLSVKNGNSYLVNIDNYHNFPSHMARDNNGDKVREKGVWVHESLLKLNKEAKVLKILRQCQTSRCVPTGNVS